MIIPYSTFIRYLVKSINQMLPLYIIFLFSRRVNPDPDVDNDALEEEEDMCPPLLQRDLKNSIDLNNSTSKLPLKGEGGLSKFGRKNLSSITLHSKVFDLTFDK